MITQQELKEYFEYRDGNLYRIKIDNNMRSVKIGDCASSITPSSGRLRIKFRNKNYQLHRLIFLYHNGYLPKLIDHIDRDFLNNKIENLRECTYQENSRNRDITNSNKSGYKGVSLQKNRNYYISIIYVNGKSIYLGSFNTAKYAARVYDRAALKYFGDYAKLNNI